jgi:hypothetical protein
MVTTTDSGVYGCLSDPCSNQLFVEGSSATKTTSSAIVYVPLYDEFLNIGSEPQAGTRTIWPNLEYSIFTQVIPNNPSPTNTLPSYTQKIENTSFVKHQFSIKNTSTVEMYVFAAVVNPANKEELRIIGSNTTSNSPNIGTVSANSSGDYWINLRLYDLCTIAENSFYPTLCTGLKALDPTDTGPHYPDVQIYFFLTNCSTIPDPNSEDVNCKTPPSPTTSVYQGGLFFKYFLGNIVNPTPPIIDSLAKGDERIKVNFSGTGIFYLNDVIGIKYPDSAIGNEQTYFQALEKDGGVLASDKNGANNSGFLVMKNLTNNQPIKVGVAYVNKFKFASRISEAEEQTPQSIQTFIQEKECYLLSAGFQRDHYVLEYFRAFRDNFLIKNFLGRGFVKWYYQTAPYYAGIIYNNAPLRFLVKSLGYLAYFTFRFFPVLIGVILICFVFFRFKAIRG